MIVILRSVVCLESFSFPQYESFRRLHLLNDLCVSAVF